MIACIWLSDDTCESENSIRNMQLWRTRFLWLIAVATTILVFVPNQKVLVTMLACALITPDNIQTVQGNIVDFIGQIVDAVKFGMR